MPHRLAIGFVLLAAISCSDPLPKPDWQIYAEIVQRDPAVPEDLSRCIALEDPSLAGDCALTVALGLARPDGRDAHIHCAEVPEGLWRQECHFIAAERARSSGQVKAAIKLCEQAGRFAADCAFHLWQRAMRTLAKRIVLERMAEQQPRMRNVHARWAKRVGHISEFDAIFWRKLFRAVWDGVSRVDPAICTILDPDLEAQCRLGAQIHFHHAFRASLRSEAWTAAFCAGEPPAVSELPALADAFPGLGRFPDHPDHQRAVAAFHKGQCVDGVLPPHPDPPRAILDARTLKTKAAQDRTSAPTQAK